MNAHADFQRRGTHIVADAVAAGIMRDSPSNDMLVLMIDTLVAQRVAEATRWFPSELRPNVPGLYARRFRLPDGQIAMPDFVIYDEEGNLTYNPPHEASAVSRVVELLGPVAQG